MAATENYDKYSPSDVAAILKEAQGRVADGTDDGAQDGSGMLNVNGRLTGITNEGVDPNEFERTRTAGNAIAEAVGLKPGERGLIVNGRVSCTFCLVRVV